MKRLSVDGLLRAARRPPSKVPFDRPRAVGRAFDLVVSESVRQPVAFVESGHARAAPQPVSGCAACFHAQQAAEKYLKAALQERDTPFPKTHDLLALLGVLPPSQARWEELGPRLEGMAQYAVDFRYPGDRAEREDAAAAVETAREVRRRARALLGLRE